MDIPHDLPYDPFEKNERSQSSFEDTFNDLCSEPAIFSDDDEGSTWEGFSSPIRALPIRTSPICTSPIRTSPIRRSPSSLPLSPTIQPLALLPPLDLNTYATLDILPEEINKVAVQQGYLIVKNGGNKKDKDGNLRKIKLTCNKGRKLKAQKGSPVRNKRSMGTSCPWKAYACREKSDWKIRIADSSHNHPAASPEAFFQNRRFTSEDLKIIEADLKSEIPPTKTLARIHALDPDVEHSMKDLHNQRAKFRKAKLGSLTPLQNLLKDLESSQGWFSTYLVDGYEQLTHLFFSYEKSLDWLEQYPDVLFIDCTYKTNAYNMPLCILTGTTSCNKTFYIGFAFMRHEDIASYRWLIKTVRKVYCQVGQADGATITLTDKEDALIKALSEEMPAAHHLLCKWHISKNVLARATKFFDHSDDVQKWLQLWKEVCEAPTFQTYQQARAELRIQDPPSIPAHRDSLFEYINREYLAGGNDQKHCYYATNQVSHFGKRVTSTSEGGHANIKRILDTPLGDLPSVVAVIAERIEDQLHKLTIKHSSDKAGRIEQGLNIGIFRYLRHEVSEYALKLMSSHWHEIKVSTCLPLCTGVFTRTLGLPCRHRMQETLWDIDKPLTRKDLHPHWWLNPLEPTPKPVAPWSRVQPPVRTRRRGRPKNPRREPSAFEIALSNLADKEKSNASTNSLPNTERSTSHVALNTSTSLSQPIPKPLPKKRQRNLPSPVLHSDLPTRLTEEVVQVAELAKETKARADDKLLRQKQKDWEKLLIDLGASKKDLRYLGESLDSHFFLRARRIKRDTISETLHQEADDEFWKQNEKNIHDRRVASGGYDLCFEMYPEDFFQLPFNKTLRDDKRRYEKWVAETGYIIPIPLIYGPAKDKLEKFLAHTCTDEEKKIEREEDSLAWRVTARGQGRDPDCIPANIDDLLEGFMESEEDPELPPPNHQENRLQPSNLERQQMQATKPLFRIPSIPANITLVDSPNTLSKKTHLAQNNLTVIPGPTTRAGRTTKRKVPASLQIDGTLTRKRRTNIEQI